MGLTIRGDIALAVLVALALIVIAARAAWWPTKRCRRCAGTGTHARLIRRSRTQMCRRCRGVGRHIRPTRRIANRVINTRHAAARSADRLAP